MENKTKKRTALLSKTIMAVLAAIIMLLGIAGAQEYSDRYDEIVAFHEELRNYIDMTDEYSVIELHSLNGEVSALLYNFYDESNEMVAYMVVSTRKDASLQCIEFGEGKTNSVLDLINSVPEYYKYDVLYLENLRYAVKYLDNEGKEYYLTEDGITSAKAFVDAESDNSQADKIYYTSPIEWADVLKEVGTGYSDGVRHYAPGASTYKSTYKTTSDFPNACAHCTSVAVYNLCAYYFSTYNFTNFELRDKASQDVLFKLIYDYLGPSADDDNIANIIKLIFMMYKYSASASYSDYVSWNSIKTAINSAPVILSLQGSQVYHDHAVLGVGYVTFSFTSKNDSKYIIVVDGWDGPFRYVNYSLGIDHINMATATPKKPNA